MQFEDIELTLRDLEAVQTDWDYLQENPIALQKSAEGRKQGRKNSVCESPNIGRNERTKIS